MTDFHEWVAKAEKELSSYGLDELKDAGVLPLDDRFMPVITYPPITMYPPIEPETVFKDNDIPLNVKTAAYVHIPFCAFQCHYCHWIKKIAPSDSEIDDYLDTLTLDMLLVAEKSGRNRIETSTALFGGGTPTYLSPKRLSGVLENFTKYFDLSGCRQFSFEAEPKSILGDSGMEKLRILKDYGVNRISLGVQSFNSKVLHTMGRSHSGDEALRAIEQIRKSGIESISIDLIYGYQGQSLADWYETLVTALESGVDAWHLYRLRIQQHGDIQGSVLEKYKTEPDQFPSVDTIYMMKAMGLVFSEENGHKQFFSRIFATGHEHLTQFMWDYCCLLTDVAGVGISAWSNCNRTFTQNVGSDFDKYTKMVRSDRLPVDRGLIRDNETEARRSFISPLKNDRVYKDRFKKRTGLDVEAHFGPEIDRLVKMGLALRDEKTIRLSPRGRFFADETVHQLFQKKYLYFPDLEHSLMPD